MICFAFKISALAYFHSTIILLPLGAEQKDALFLSLQVVSPNDGFPMPTESDGFVMSDVNENLSVFLKVPRVKADPEKIREKMEKLIL